jgi:hypothetical protein
MSYLGALLLAGLLIGLWALLVVCIGELMANPDIRRDYYEARLDFLIWLTQCIVRSRHDEDV